MIAIPVSGSMNVGDCSYNDRIRGKMPSIIYEDVHSNQDVNSDDNLDEQRSSKPSFAAIDARKASSSSSGDDSLVIVGKQQQQHQQCQKKDCEEEDEEQGEIQNQKKKDEEDKKRQQKQQKKPKRQQKAQQHPRPKQQHPKEKQQNQNQEPLQPGWSHNNNNNAFADSPYFNAFVEKEMNSLRLNADIMKEIACKASSFSDAGKTMAKAARELSMSCRFIKPTEHDNDNDNEDNNTTTIDEEELNLRKKTVGEKSATILKHFAMILEDIAIAQENIATAVEASLGSHMAENAMTQVKRANVYKAEAIKQSEEAENHLYDYLNKKYGETVAALNTDIASNSSYYPYSSYLSPPPTATTGTTSSSSLTSSVNTSKYYNNDRAGMMSRSLSTRSVMNKNPAGMMNRSLSTRSMMNKNFHHSSSSQTSRGGMMTKSLSIRGGSMMNSPHSRGGMNNNRNSPSIMNSLKKTMSFRWTETDTEPDDSLSPDDSSNISPFATNDCIVSCPNCNNTIEQIEEQQKNDNVINNKAIKMANLKYNLEQIRVDQATAQLRRFRLSGLFVEASYKQDIRLSQNTYKVMYEMQSYYRTCFEALSELLPKTKKVAKDVVRTQKSNIIGWKEGENKIVEIVNNFKSHAMESYEEVEVVEEEVNIKNVNSFGGCYFCNNSNNNTGNNSNSDYNILIDQESLTQEVLLLKENCRLWNSLPSALATTANYPRMKPPGIIVEGWVYENTASSGMITTIMSTKSQWIRKWFMLKDDGIIYSLQSNPERISDYQCCTYKAKVCNVVLCAVQQQQQQQLLQNNNNNANNNCGNSTNIVKNYNDNTDTRFCFKLITPNLSNPITIKTIGPDDLCMWLNGIKSSIMDQLSKGGGRGGDGQGGIGASLSSCVSEINQQPSCEIENTFLDITSSSLYNINNKRREVEKSSTNNICKNDSNNKSTTISNNNSNDNNRKRNNENIWGRVREANSTCADCGKASPDWVSLNFGILICINCSGAHRSLGTHMSKVRSISLDSLSDREALLILSLGNARMNKIFEKSCISSQNTSNCSSSSNERKKDNGTDDSTIEKNIEKPVISEHMDRMELEKWIKRKYVTKEFLLARPGDEAKIFDRDRENYKDLYDASCSLNVYKMAYAIAQGADIDWKYNHSSVAADNNGVLEEESKIVPAGYMHEEKETTITTSSTSLGACVRSKSGTNKLECIELLLQNGSSLSLLSSYERSLLDNHLSSTGGGNGNRTKNPITTSTGFPSRSKNNAPSDKNTTTTTDDDEKMQTTSDIISGIENMYLPEGSRYNKQLKTA